jgi:penicillin-binding protein 2
MARAISAIANYGRLVTPHLILGDAAKETEISTINLSRDYFDVIHQGMRDSVLHGTSSALNVPYVKVASKTGTAQLGAAKNKVNSWIIGFFPYQDPKYAFTVMMESGPSINGVGAPLVMQRLLNWMSINAPEYFQ